LQAKIIQNQRIAFFTSKTTFLTMTCYNEKEATGLIYHIKLLFRVNDCTKFELSTENVILVFPYLEQIFGET